MGLFSNRKQEAGTNASQGIPTQEGSHSGAIMEQSGDLIVLAKDGVMPDTRERIAEFRRQGLTDVTVVIDTGGLGRHAGDLELIALTEMETREALEEKGFTANHVTVARR